MNNNFNHEQDRNTEKPALLQLLMDPETQFINLRANPRIWGTLIIVTILFVIGTVLQMSYIDPGTVIDAELEGILQPGEEHIAYMLVVFGSGIASLFMPTIIILVSTVIYLLIAKLIKSPVSFRQLFSMNTYILFINALGVFINGLLIASIGGDPDFIVTSLGSYVQPDTMLGAILSNFELFSIWALVLTALGLQIVANFSKRAAWTVTIGFFVFGIVVSMVGSAFTMLANTL